MANTSPVSSMTAPLNGTRRDRRAALFVPPPAPAAETQEPNTYGTEADTRRKRLDGLKAGFAFLGYALDELAGGELLAHRWGLSRRLESAEAAEAFLAAIGQQAR